MVDFWSFDANSSLLKLLRIGGVIQLSDYQIKGVQANRVIAVYQDRVLLPRGEYPFTTSGLSQALDRIREIEFGNLMALKK